MKKIKITYYALLREQRGESVEVIQTDLSTAEELYAQLKEKHGFTLLIDVLRIAINDQFADWNTVLSEGDHIIFIPPVAGG